MEYIQQISSTIIVVLTMVATFLGIIEKSQSIKWKPLSKLFGLDGLTNEINLIKIDIKDIKSEQEKIKEEQNDDSLDEYRNQILQFASMLKNDYIPDEVEFQHIHEVYDKYLKKGGNSYIHQKMDYIERMEKLFINK